MESPDNATSKMLEEQLQKVRQRVLKEAEASAAAENRDSVELEDIASAYLKIVPGTRLYKEKYPTPVHIMLSFFDRIFSSITGLTLISAILAIVFGYLGYYSQDPETRAGFLDIAKGSDEVKHFLTGAKLLTCKG